MNSITSIDSESPLGLFKDHSIAFIPRGSIATASNL